MPISTSRSSPPLYSHHNSRAQSLLRKYSTTNSKLVLAKILHYLGENFQRLFRLQNCLSRKSSTSWNYSETFSLQKYPSRSQQPSSHQKQPAIIQQAVFQPQPASSSNQHQQPAIIQLAVSSRNQLSYNNQQHQSTTTTSSCNQQQQRAAATSSSNQQQQHD